MAEKTKISWATSSFNPWLGCSRVHTGCANCYAEAMAGRLGVTWGQNGTRRRTADSTWRQVERWNRIAGNRQSCAKFAGGTETEAKYSESPRVFPSLCDPFEIWEGEVLAPDLTAHFTADDGSCSVASSALHGAATTDMHYTTLDDVRRDFFALIDRCPNLDFLLLTKRPENVRRMWPPREWHDGAMRAHQPTRGNVWLIYSASDQQTLEAGLHHLLACRDLVPVLGVSLEPLVGPIDLGAAHVKTCPHGAAGKHVCDAVDWVIVGGESGPHARPLNIEWLESIADQCSDAGVPLFVKQDSGRKPGQQGRIPDRLWARKEFPR